MKLLTLLVAVATLTSGCAHSYKHKKHGHYAQKRLMKATHGEHRSLANKARDSYRNPVETLSFFELEPHMTVVEISPGRGWYTEILGPFLKKKGKLYLATHAENTSSEYGLKMRQDLKQSLEQNKDLYGDVEFTVFEAPERIEEIAPAGTADRVVTFRSLHGIMRNKKGEEAFKAFYAALKPGGILGVVQHREAANKRQDASFKSGYVREDSVIELAESVGFEFVAKSEVNANYLDTRNHPDGVWSLPPSLRGDKKDRAKYLAIGESDRMTLKFRKPL